MVEIFAFFFALFFARRFGARRGYYRVVRAHSAGGAHPCCGGVSAGGVLSAREWGLRFVPRDARFPLTCGKILKFPDSSCFYLLTILLCVDYARGSNQFLWHGRTQWTLGLNAILSSVCMARDS